jgi:5'-nucleotidase
VKWDTARALAPDVIRTVIGMEWAADVCLNINFPDVEPQQAKPLQITRQGIGRMDGLNITKRTDMREQGYYWLNIDRHERPDFDDSETFVVTHGGVSVTPLRFERTDLEVMSRLKNTLAN